MSDFQLSLIAIGAFVVAGVLVYNKLQERSARRAAERNFASRHPDVLLDDSAPARREPTLAAPARPGVGEVVPGPLPEARLDYVIEMSVPRPAGAANLLELWAPLERRFAPRAMLAGSADGAVWQRIAPRDAGSHSMLRAALQLANRSGVASEADLLEFRAQVETLAAGLGATITAAPEMKQAMEVARELDGFCAEHDIQIVFHVVAQPGTALPGTKLRAAAEAAGLHLEDDGRFALRDDRGALLFAMGDRAGVRFSGASLKDAAPQALTLAMDMPRAPDTQRSFEAMARFARNLASLLGGTLVDDNNRALDPRALEAIGAQLEGMRRSMLAREIEPGGALARRLFS